MKSGPKELNWEDVLKGIKAFFWNLVSLSIAVTGFLLALPKEQVPEWMWGILIASPMINGLAVVILKWKQDNRM